MSIEEGEVAKIAKIFCCYADADRALWHEFEEHLVSLEHTGRIIKWHEGDIQPGTLWEQELEKLLQDVNVILLFLSSSFLSSTFCYQLMQQALEIRRARKVQVIPILLRPAYLKGIPISRLQPLPSNWKPVTLWDNRDEAFRDIVQGINDVINAPPRDISDADIDMSDDFADFIKTLFGEKYDRGAL